MHGLNMAISVAEQFRFCSPHLCFTNALQRSSACLQTSLTEADTSEQPFALPHRPSASANSRGGVNASDLFFRLPFRTALEPGALWTPGRFLLVPGTIPIQNPFPKCSVRNPSLALKLPLPFGILRPLWIVALSLIPNEEACPTFRPISLRSSSVTSLKSD